VPSSSAAISRGIAGHISGEDGGETTFYKLFHVSPGRVIIAEVQQSARNTNGLRPASTTEDARSGDY